MKRSIFCVTLLCLPLLSIFGQLDGNPENWCRNGAFPRDSESYGIAYVKAAGRERVYFFDDDRNCPNDQNCRRKSYLVNRDEVLISRTYGDYVCAWYQPKKGSEVVGWLPKANLEIASLPPVRYETWLGSWTHYDNSLTFARARQNSLKVKGSAFWKGVGDNIHIGEVDSAGTPDKSGFLQVTDGVCEIKFRLVGKYLVVSDNLNCGGMNVSFSGVYRKRSPR